jgi:EmrB/QacA subfamily drug resistance transporter
MSRPQLILVVASVMLGMLLAALDQTIVGTAMPRIIAQLNGLEHYAWVATAYLLASTVMVPIYGKLSDIYGRKPFFLLGMLLFLLGSALSGASETMTQLIFFRAIQGLGAGAMMPIVQAIIGDIFPPAERGKWQGLLMAVFGLSSIVGPTAGGWITDNWGWRWVFYVNMPVGAAAVAVAALALPSVGRRRQHQIDYRGALTLAAGAVPLLLAFSWAGTQYAWGSAQIIGLLIVAAVMLAAFVVVETRVAEPIITPALFRNSIFTVSVVATFLLAAGMFGAILYLPLFVQGVLGNTATNSGVVLTPMMLGFIVSSTIGGQILSRTGRYKVLALAGFVVATAGMFLLSRMDVTTTDGVVVRNMVITGLGVGVMMSLFTIVVQNAFPFHQLGQVTASVQFFRSMGSTIGIAILGTVLTNQFQSGLQANMPATLKHTLPPGKLAALQNPQVLLAPGVEAKIKQDLAAFGPQGQVLFQQLMHAIRVSLAGAITDLFVATTGVMLLAFITTLFLREIPLRTSNAPSAPADGAAALEQISKPLGVSRPSAWEVFQRKITEQQRHESPRDAEADRGGEGLSG